MPDDAIARPVAAERGLLRFLTCGSVDDGKSTLIGRLLYNAELVLADQLEALERESRRFGTTGGDIDFSLLLDGLEDERQQRITIDVAYRFFATPRRAFIVANTPGHEQYTRNMVTGASTADLAVLLVDARKGLLEQSRRHAYIIWMLGIRHIVLAVNKMDLIDYSQRRFADIETNFSECTAFMENLARYFVPVSALTGENVISLSRNMPWYSGPSLLKLLESVVIKSGCNPGHFRFPVQNVIRPDSDFRGYGGQIVSGSVQPEQEVMALPSGRRTKVHQIILYKQTLRAAC